MNLRNLFQTFWKLLRACFCKQISKQTKKFVLNLSFRKILCAKVKWFHVIFCEQSQKLATCFACEKKSFWNQFASPISLTSLSNPSRMKIMNWKENSSFQVNFAKKSRLLNTIFQKKLPHILQWRRWILSWFQRHLVSESCI